jgi:DNA-binding NarL/FixJ family response regulator
MIGGPGKKTCKYEWRSRYGTQEGTDHARINVTAHFVCSSRRLSASSKKMTVVPTASLTASLNKVGLTARERQVLERLQLGASNKLIGRQLNLRESTVKVHIRRILRKLGAVNRTQAALCAVRLSIPATDTEAD